MILPTVSCSQGYTASGMDDEPDLGNHSISWFFELQILCGAGCDRYCLVPWGLAVNACARAHTDYPRTPLPNVSCSEAGHILEFQPHKRCAHLPAPGHITHLTDFPFSFPSPRWEWRGPSPRVHHGGDSFVCQALNDWLCEK